jgi:septal ring factor EnvC (AmiA/AmiB activator)
MRPFIRTALCITLLGAATLSSVACVTSSDVEKLQSQISDLQEQLVQVKRTSSSKEEVQNVNKTIADQTQMLLKSNATLVAKVDQIEDKMQSGQGAVEQTNNRLDRIAQQLTQTR